VNWPFELGVSELTIRRDLDLLSEKGVLERTHGGATLRRVLNIEPDYLQKAAKFPEQKKAIGKMAADLVDENDIVFVNSGSTTLEVIRALLDRDLHITLVTNNIDAMWLYKSGSNVSLVLAGGYYRPISHSVSGMVSASVIEQVFANKAIIGVDGFSMEAGLSTPVFDEAETTRAMIKNCVGTTIVVAAGDKIGVVSNYKTISLDGVDILVTDEMGGKLMKAADAGRSDIQIMIATM
jgi:DeoR family fructose operon transcriptional repressor